MTFKVGLSRDILDSKGEPSFGRAALAVLDGNPALEWEYFPERFTELTPDIASQYDGIYISSPKVTRASLARADRRVKIIARHGVGYDSVDIPATSEFGVIVTNTPLAIRRPMAVAALTLIFALASRLAVKDRLVREDRWFERTNHMGLGFTGRTLGLIGAGGIGQEIMGLAKPFFGRMIAADPYGDASRVASFGASLAPLETVMAESDFVVCCCLLTDETRHIVDAARLARMKPSAFLINVARGPVVDEPALIAALRAGTIAGAGLDVFEKEPIGTDNPLKTMDNVLLAPHSLGWTDECFHDIASTGLKSIVDFSLGRRPVHMVNPEALGPASAGGRSR
ncbi:MAG: dehydrogenase [Alphaproteobacteria bacterium]|nr:dehydrogenase [Alphaproteobacteria bacterium]